MATKQHKPIPQLTPRDIDRFWNKVDKSPGQGPHGHCWTWTGGKGDDGYGHFWACGTTLVASRVALYLSTGYDPGALCAMHTCDYPPCIRDGHLKPGTYADNTADMYSKGRADTGDHHYSRTNPEKLARGDRSGARLHPERIPRGVRSGPTMHPERMSRGDAHWTRLRPADTLHGEAHGRSKLTRTQVDLIRERYAAGGVSKAALAREFRMSEYAIFAIITRHTWK